MSSESEKYIDLHLAAASPPIATDQQSPRKKRLWRFVQDWLFRPSPQAHFMWWRRSLLRFFGAEVGQKVQIMPTVRVACPWNVTFGDRVWIGDFAELYSLDKIVIEEDAVISQHVYLCTGTHDYNRLDFPLVTKPIKVEKQAWLATRSFIAPGITIGQGAIVGAQSVVLRDIPPASIYAGNPAVFIKPRLLPVAPLAANGR